MLPRSGDEGGDGQGVKGFTGIFETIFAFLARCGRETGSGAGRGEVEYFDGVFKSAVYSGGGDEMGRGEKDKDTFVWRG